MSPYHGSRPLALSLAVLFLAGCAAIPGVPTQNILMFSGDGRAVDPTGNASCTEGASGSGPLCHEARPGRGTFTHVGARDYTELDDGYYTGAYLKSLFGCLHEYSRSSPTHPPGSPCKQEPRIAPPPETSAGVKRLLIFIHGGLNTQIGAIQRVVEREDRNGTARGTDTPLYNEIAQAGYYPLFINWRASFTSNYVDGITLIRQGEKQPWLGPVTVPAVVAVDIARAITRAPLVWAGQTINDLKATPGFSFLESRDPDAVAAELICAYEFPRAEKCPTGFRFKKPPFCVPFNVRAKKDLDGNRDFDKSPTPNPDTVQISVGEDRRGCPEMDVAFFAYLVTLPTRLLLEPVVDALGTSAWEIMLRRTRLLFNRDDEFRHRPEDRPADGLATTPRNGGVSILLRQLAREIESAKKADGRDWEITLVGHSMGSIIANQILRETVQLQLQLPIKNIVYMAAAASVRDVLDSIVPYLREKTDAGFYNLMLHPIADEREIYTLGEIPVDPGPRGSLLVMIDTFLSKPLTYLDRTAGRYQNFLPAVHNIPRDLWPRVRIKTFSVGGEVRNENPQRHGEFTSRFKFWIKECWQPDSAMEPTAPRDCIYDP